jgi:hypothetical protein
MSSIVLAGNMKFYSRQKFQFEVAAVQVSFTLLPSVSDKDIKQIQKCLMLAAEYFAVFASNS